MATTAGVKLNRSVYITIMNLPYSLVNKLNVCALLVFILTSASSSYGENTYEDSTYEFLKREYSLSKPYQGLGSSSSSHWEFMGNSMIMPDTIRLTPDLQSRQGAVWSRIPCYIRDWELRVQFKIHGDGKKNLNGDGLAIWLTKERMQSGPVFGNINYFTGLGIFVDTYPNDDKQHDRVFPFISAMVGNGSVEYDHDRDGRSTDLGGCNGHSRNVDHDTFLLIRYMKNRLTVMTDVDGKQEWKDCLDIPGVKLPQGYYFGASSVTGDLSDNHDLISFKLYELTVERSPEEEEEDQLEITLPSVDYRVDPNAQTADEGRSILATFFIFIFSVFALVVVVVVILFAYNHYKENRRKRFY
ncbi:lectin, mannose-binding 2-like b [Triplophysa rosa]|uniref:Lman2lb protein n=1 Tax=Triplophysa rosa TaxID=992332 RepID=A0A9W7X473_TRIRA|nr:lectin, mannose-binding 2-like b [Triplophysa rosa]KAI7813621.1 Lman2lb protein [Triplophysa rosa]